MSLRTLSFGVLAVGLILAVGITPAMAQDNIFALSYFTNAHTKIAPYGALRLVNDGAVSDASPAGDLCASIYVFDTREEMLECCSCRITPNGILSLNVDLNLTNNPLTGVVPTRGVVKVVSSKRNGSCDATAVAPQAGIKGWLTHPQKTYLNAGTIAGWTVTEEELLDSSYGSAESADLAEDCLVLTELGSGQGICSCADSGQ